MTKQLQKKFWHLEKLRKHELISDQEYRAKFNKLNKQVWRARGEK